MSVLPREFPGRTAWIQFRFDSIPGAAETTGQNLASNTYNLGTALVFKKSRAFTFTVQLDGEVASGYRAVAGQAVGQWLF